MITAHVARHMPQYCVMVWLWPSRALLRIV